MAVKYILLDTNVTAAYYLSLCTKSKNVRERVENIFDSARSGESELFFYLPNFCVAEVFSVFMKYTFGSWNNHVKGSGTIDKRVYNSIVKQFEEDIHNGRFIYHYELSRYHVLAINLVAPIDHYFQISRTKIKRKTGKRTSKPNVRPMGTLDHLIIAMGVHLTRIHGKENVAIVSADNRLIDVLAKCKTTIPFQTKRKLRLDKAEALTGIKFGPDAFPQHINLINAKKADLVSVFGKWPLDVGRVGPVYRWKNT